MAREGSEGKQSVCQKSGLQCWWKIATHLGWSLLDLSEGLSPLESTDSNSEALAQILFATYLVLALILLINMLIALLSNTYQRVQDNSRNEWGFKKAIAIQTYRNYHPIPPPLNIFSIPALWIYNRCKGKAEKTDPLEGRSLGKRGTQLLLNKYRLKYGDSFPPTNKIDQVLNDAENTERMVIQILCRAFTCQKGHDKALLPTGCEAWEAHKSLLVEDHLITCLPPVRNDSFEIGARYKVPFSHRFPHFEVMILGSGETNCIALGVVGSQQSLEDEGTVGYHIRNLSPESDQETIGTTIALQGDVIRCTVVFEEEQKIDGKIQVPVVFSVNGTRIVPEDKLPTFTEHSEDRPLFPYVAFQNENSALAKMCAREDVDYQGQEIKSRLAEMESKLECFDKTINVVRECCEKNLSMMETLLKKISAEEKKP